MHERMMRTERRKLCMLCSPAEEGANRQAAVSRYKQRVIGVIDDWFCIDDLRGASDRV